MGINILVTDGANKNCLAAIRALGRNTNYFLSISTPYRNLLSLVHWSKYCDKTYQVKSQLGTSIYDIDPYAEDLLRLVEDNSFDILIPVSLKSNIAVSKYKNKILKRTSALIPSFESMLIAFNKERTINFAKNAGICVPETRIFDKAIDLNGMDTFPFVVKTSDGFLRYVNDGHDLIEVINSIQKRKFIGKIIAQEYITGFGCGYYAIYHEGSLKANFAHKRLLEYPNTGGPSAIAESYYDERLIESGRKLCDKLNWNGPIMVEFKYDFARDRYVLMEINPKLWGSLDLTIAAGINVPKIIVDLSLGNDVPNNFDYNYVKYRWLFPDEYFARISSLSANNIHNFIRNSDGSQTNYDPDDIAPFVFQLARSILDTPRVLIRRNPQGKVQ